MFWLGFQEGKDRAWIAKNCHPNAFGLLDWIPTTREVIATWELAMIFGTQKERNFLLSAVENLIHSCVSLFWDRVCYAAQAGSELSRPNDALISACKVLFWDELKGIDIEIFITVMNMCPLMSRVTFHYHLKARKNLLWKYLRLISWEEQARSLQLRASFDSE